MKAADLIHECRRRGVRLLIEGSELRYVGPSGAVDQRILHELRQTKPAVVAILTAIDGEAQENELQPAPPAQSLDLDPEVLRARFEERAAILEFDAGYPRHEAERLAWEMTGGPGTSPGEQGGGQRTAGEEAL